MKKSLLYSGLFFILTATAFAEVNTSSPQNNPAPPQGVVTPTPTTTVTPRAQVIDCNYKIPAEMTNIDQTLVMQWAEKAVQLSFDMEPNRIDEHLNALKSCFTDQGWTSYNDALQKSGNIKAIRTQKLMVSSMVDGKSTVNVVKDNQWKVSIPLQVVYQNDKEKLTQLLAVDLIIGRKVSGDLGIMQMIASPRSNPIAKESTGQP